MFSQSRLYMSFFGALLAVFAVVSARADSNDPPGRAARLSYTRGATSFSPAGETEWVDTVVNRPLISGDRLWADSDGRAEIEVGSSALRLDANTNFELVYLDDRTTQVQVTQGTLDVSLRHFSRDQHFEVDTPTLAVTLDESGRYRIEVDADGQHTTVVVMRGSATARGDNAEYPLQAGDRVRFHGTDLRDAEQLNAYAADDFDRFCATRDDRAEHAASLRYVGIDVVGAYDLDEYGSWSSQRDYGHVWYPSHVDANWAPYSDGHWIWQDPWGWTWVDNAPWGFAPSHYGRWVSIENRWGWVPGPRGDHAIYAPALVAFIGGAGFSIGISVGGAGPIGWFPLGARDVYAPPYRASHDYFTRVNVTNTTINNTYITNVYNNYSSDRPLTQATYANETVPGAVTAVPGNVFVNAQPVRAAAVRVDQKALASARILPMAAVAPSARSVTGNAPAARAKPADAVLERKVVAQTPPPPKPVPFAARQQELQRTPGRPLTPSAIAALQPGAGAAAAASNVRVLGPQPGAVDVRAAGPAKAAPAVGAKPPPPQISAPPAEQKRTMPTPPQLERSAPPAEEKRAAAPPPLQQQERKAAPVEQKRTAPTPPPQQEQKAPPQQQQQHQQQKAQKQQQRPQPPPQPPQPQQNRSVPTLQQQQRNAPPAQQKAKDAEKKDAGKDAEKKDADKKDGGGNLLPGS